MPSTYLDLHYHLVYRTKDSQTIIAPEWQKRLHGYLGGIIREQGGVPECVGGTGDHVHLLVGLKATHRLCDLLRELKHSSSHWVHETIQSPQFAWQDGYGAFTVSGNRRPTIKEYILNQANHHRTRGYEEEFKAFLRQAGIEFDEGYLR